jgi:hypothetical protein
VEGTNGLEIRNRLPTENYESDAARRSRGRVDDLGGSRDRMGANAKGTI